MANDGTVKIGVDFDVDKKGLDGIGDEVEKGTGKARVSIEEYAKTHNQTIEQVKAQVASLAAEYQTSGKTMLNAYKQAYSDMGVYSETAWKKLQKANQNIESSSEEAGEANKEMAEKIGDAVESAEELQKEAKEAGESIKNLGEKTKDAAEYLNDMGKNMSDAASSTDKLKKELQSVGRIASASLSGLKTVSSVAASGVQQAFSAAASSAKAATDIGLKSITTISGAMAGIAAFGTKYNSAIEQYQTSFEVMTGSAEKAAEIVETLRAMGAATPFEMSNLAEVTKLLMNYGFTADEAIDSMSMLGDISQGNSEKMTRVATAYGQMSSAGKVLLEDVKQMIEAGFNPLQEISETTGESMASLYDRISKGTITVDEITASIQRSTSEGGKYFQSMEKQSKTTAGQISTLKDNVSQLAGVISGDTTSAISQDLLPTLNKMVAELQTAFESGGFEEMADKFGGFLTELVGKGADSLPTMIGMGSDILSAIANGMVENSDKLSDSLLTVALSLPEFILQNLNSIFTVGGVFIQKIAEGAKANSSYLSDTIVNLIFAIPEFLISNMSGLLPVGSEIINKILEGVAERGSAISDDVINILMEIPDLIINNLGMLLQVGSAFISKISESITDNAGELSEAAVEVITMFAGFLSDNIPVLIDTAKTLIKSFAEALSDEFPELKSFTNIIELLVDNFEGLAKVIIPVTAGIKGLSIIKNLASVIVSVGKGFGSFLGLITAITGPIGVAVLAIGGLVAVIGALALAHQDEQTELDKAIEKEQERSKQIQDDTQKLKDMKDAAKDTADAEYSQIQKTQDLWDELQKLADASGNVKEADRERAEYITSKLEEATGLEIEMVDGQIKKYDELKEKIGEVIEQKRAEALLNAYQGSYEEALTQYENARKNYNEAQRQRDELLAEKEAFEENLRNQGYTGNLAEELESKGGLFQEQYGLTEQEIQDYITKFIHGQNGSLSLYAEISSQIAPLEKQYKQAYDMLSAYEQAEEAFYNGRYDEVADFLSYRNRAEIDMINATEEEKRDIMKDSYNTAANDYKLALKANDQAAMEQAQETMDKLLLGAYQAGEDIGELFGAGAKEAFEKEFEYILVADKLAQRSNAVESIAIPASIQSGGDLATPGYAEKVITNSATTNRNNTYNIAFNGLTTEEALEYFYQEQRKYEIGVGKK